MRRMVVFDFYNLLHRSYHAFPREMKTSTGVQTNAVYGFISSVLNIIKEFNPQYVIVAGESGPSFRKEQFEDYKATRTWRKDHPDEAKELDAQAELVKEILSAMEIPLIDIPTYEADDVIGSVTKKFAKDNVEMLLISNDMDMLQLVNGFVKAFRPARPPFVKKKMYTKEEVVKSFGFGPDKIVDYKSLRGDPSDNIPGVKGIGEKTAKKLIHEFGSLENIYKNIDAITPPALKKKLTEGKESAFLSKELSTIKIDVPVETSLKDAEIKDFRNENVLSAFNKYEFKSLLEKLSSDKTPPTHENQMGLGL
ncbi:MAG: 5'-3' exonuclease H3TH domain-containing protein [Patescibacteria group bacterium]